MAIPAAALTFIGQPGSSAAQGQSVSGYTASGPLSKVLAGVATFTLDGATTTGLVVNFIDGAQKLFQQTDVLQVVSVTAPATIGGVAAQAVYTSVGPVGQLRVGQSITFGGFANAGNNGAFTINALSTTGIQVTNTLSIAETNPAGTGTVNVGAHVASVQGSRAMYNGSTVDTGAATIYVVGVHDITDATCKVDISAAGTNAQTLSVLCEIFPNQ